MRTIARLLTDTAREARRAYTALMLAFAAAVAGGCADRAAGEYERLPYGTISIAHLKSLATAESAVITDDVAITGYVVANDLYGEFYKTIVVCDTSGGIEIAVDSATTATLFPISARITVHCSGLALGDYGGRIMLGARPTGAYTVDRISVSDLARYFTADTSAPAAPDPLRVSIGGLAPEHIGRLIELHDVTFAHYAGLTWCDTDPETGDYITTSRALHDTAGHSVAVRTIAQCLYRAESIPSGYGTVRAVVEYFNGGYSLRIANHGIEFPRSGE